MTIDKKNAWKNNRYNYKRQSYFWQIWRFFCWDPTNFSDRFYPRISDQNNPFPINSCSRISCRVIRGLLLFSKNKFNRIDTRQINDQCSRWNALLTHMWKSWKVPSSKNIFASANFPLTIGLLFDGFVVPFSVAPSGGLLSIFCASGMFDLLEKQ